MEETHGILQNRSISFPSGASFEGEISYVFHMMISYWSLQLYMLVSSFHNVNIRGCDSGGGVYIPLQYLRGSASSGSTRNQCLPGHAEIISWDVLKTKYLCKETCHDIHILLRTNKSNLYNRKYRSTTLPQDISWDNMRPESCPSVVLSNELYRNIFKINAPWDVVPEEIFHSNEKIHSNAQVADGKLPRRNHHFTISWFHHFTISPFVPKTIEPFHNLESL